MKLNHLTKLLFAVIALLLVIGYASAEISPLVELLTIPPPTNDFWDVPYEEDYADDADKKPRQRWAIRPLSQQFSDGTIPAPLVDEHFLSFEKIDMEKTTALVKKDLPGTVTIKKPLHPFALRPGVKQIALADQDKINIYGFTGNEMRHCTDIELSGVQSLTYTSTGRFLVALKDKTIKAYGFQNNGQAKEIWQHELQSPALKISASYGDGFALLTKEGVKLFGWDGNKWRETGGLTGFENPRAISYDQQSNSLAVLDGDTIKYFRWHGSGFRLVDTIVEQGVYDIALGINGVRVLKEEGNSFYAFTGTNMEAFPRLDQRDQGIWLSKSPWGLHDFVLATKEGLRYMGFTGSTFRYVPQQSIELNTDGDGRGELDPPEPIVQECYSTVFTLEEPVNSVLLEAEIIELPENSSVRFEVSTDCGVTWTEIQPSNPTDVPEGTLLAYKIILEAPDWEHAPVVDRIKISRAEEFVLGGAVVPVPAERGRKIAIKAEARDPVQPSERPSIKLDSMKVTIPVTDGDDGFSVMPDGYQPHTAEMDFNDEEGVYYYEFLIPSEIKEAGKWPDDGRYQVKIVGQKGGRQKEELLDFEIKGNILKRVIIKTTKW